MVLNLKAGGSIIKETEDAELSTMTELSLKDTIRIISNMEREELISSQEEVLKVIFQTMNIMDMDNISSQVVKSILESIKMEKEMEKELWSPYTLHLYTLEDSVRNNLHGKGVEIICEDDDLYYEHPSFVFKDINELEITAKDILKNPWKVSIFKWEWDDNHTKGRGEYIKEDKDYTIIEVRDGIWEGNKKTFGNLEGKAYYYDRIEGVQQGEIEDKNLNGKGQHIDLCGTMNKGDYSNPLKRELVFVDLLGDERPNTDVYTFD